MDRFEKVSKEFGARLLREAGIKGTVERVDFTADAGGGCPTCAYTDYEVEVIYRNRRGEWNEFTKTYQSMSCVIRALLEC